MEYFKLALISSLLTYLFRTLIGYQSGHWFYGSIFSDYIFLLSKRKLTAINIYKNVVSEQINMPKKDFAKLVYDMAVEHFTWQKAIGVCSSCTNIWVTFIVMLFNYSQITVLSSLIIVSISNFLTSIYNKYL